MNSSTPYLETAYSIGAEICRDAIWYSDQCNWLGDSPGKGSRGLSTSSLGPSLYGGTIGVALFLAHLAKLTGEKWFHQCSIAAARQASEKVQSTPDTLGTGYYDGLTGIACSLIEVGHVLQEESLNERGSKLLGQITAGKEWESADVISGKAGIILGLADIRKRFAADIDTDLFSMLGRSLIKSAESSEHGYSWKTSSRETEQNLNGFAHGVAGVVTSLACLKKLLETSDYDEAISGGLAYERHWYNAECGNWPDFRRSSKELEQLTTERPGIRAWCHGAPGILLSRLVLRLYGVLPDNDTDLQNSLTSTVTLLENQPAHSDNYSLCHGRAGNALILQYVSQLPGKEHLKKHVTEVADFGLHHYGGHLASWPSGVVGGGFTPNLMLGLSGTGFFYLQLHDSSNLPSLLCPRLFD